MRDRDTQRIGWSLLSAVSAGSPAGSRGGMTSCSEEFWFVMPVGTCLEEGIAEIRVQQQVSGTAGAGLQAPRLGIRHRHDACFLCAGNTDREQTRDDKGLLGHE